MSPSRCTHLAAVAVSCLSQASLQCPGGNNRRAVGRTALPWAGAPAQPWARVRYEMELEGHRSGTATTVGAYLAVQYLLRTACSLSPAAPTPAPISARGFQGPTGGLPNMCVCSVPEPNSPFDISPATNRGPRPPPTNALSLTCVACRRASRPPQPAADLGGRVQTLQGLD
ncbi:hypothetical protein ACCO45_000738 [Purpureocillium lilacinum]|uniref:Uncharacterized protein n=1 Tax=Purpureocillium lilacinum TaxID=33203 RepID=A0ACC4E7N1_PURLI